MSLSITNSAAFGSGARVKGFFLNNSGYNFSYMEEGDWKGKHPAYRVRSSTIAPTIILDAEKQIKMVIGTPGGSRIPTAIAQATMYILEYGMDPLEAVRMPRIYPSTSSDNVWIDRRFEAEVLAEARQIGFDVQLYSPDYARIYLVARQDGKWIGISDPRHYGEPRGF